MKKDESKPLLKIEIIVNEVKMDILMDALKKYHITGMTISKVHGCGVQYGTPEYQDVDTSQINLLEKTIIMLVVPEDITDQLIDHLSKDLYTGHIGDGKIFVTPVYNAYRIRTGENGYQAIIPGDL